RELTFQRAYALDFVRGPDDHRRDAGDDGAGRNVLGYYSAGAHERAFANRHAAEDRRVAADRGAPRHPRFDQLPVRLGLQDAFAADGTRIRVVDEHHPVTDEDAVLDGDAVADEGVARDLAVGSDHGAALHLDEGADARVAADPAAVQVDQPRLWNRHVWTHLYVGRNHES